MEPFIITLYSRHYFVVFPMMLIFILISIIQFGFVCSIPEQVLKNGSNRFPSEPTWITGDWNNCNVTCGDGIQERTVECKIFLQVSRTIALLPEFECMGMKPMDQKPCFLPPCSVSPSSSQLPFSSRLKQKRREDEDEGEEDEFEEALKDGFSNEIPASNTRKVTGIVSVGTTEKRTQEQIFECTRSTDGMTVSSFLCEIDDKPVTVSKSCNNHPCHPSWDVGEWSECNVTCGVGSRERNVECKIFLEFSRTIATLPDDECPWGKPMSRTACFRSPCPLVSTTTSVPAMVTTTVPKNGRKGIKERRKKLRKILKEESKSDSSDNDEDKGIELIHELDERFRNSLERAKSVFEILLKGLEEKFESKNGKKNKRELFESTFDTLTSTGFGKKRHGHGHRNHGHKHRHHVHKNE